MGLAVVRTRDYWTMGRLLVTRIIDLRTFDYYLEFFDSSSAVGLDILSALLNHVFSTVNPYLLDFGNIQERHFWKKSRIFFSCDDSGDVIH